MKPEPFFTYDNRSGRIYIKQNHKLAGRILIKLEEFLDPVKASAWNANKRLPRDVHQAGRLLNLLTALNEQEQKLIIKGIKPTLQDCYDKLTEPEDAAHPTSNRIADWCSWLSTQHSANYGRGFSNIIQHLEDWHKPSAQLVDLNTTWVQGYARYLNERGLRKSSISKQIGYLRQVVKSAQLNKVQVGTVPDSIKISGKPSKQRMPLNLDEIMKLQALTKLPRHLERVRDYFLLMCTTGVRISDLGVDWIVKPDRIIHTQQKTDHVHVITINPLSEPLIKKYSSINIDGVRTMDIEPLAPQYMNRQLEVLRKKAGIKTHMSNHIGRHSMGRLLRDIGCPEHIVAAELGHRNKSVTAGYGMIDGGTQVAIVSRKFAKALAIWNKEPIQYEKWFLAVNE